jgi:hypothetical protein
MADNVAITQGTGTDVATDDVGSVHYQKIKLALGADGAIDTLLDSGQQAMAASAPVVLASDHTDVKITLDGETVTVASHAVTNAGTFAVQVDGNALTALQLIDDAVYVDDADWTDDTSKHLLVGGVYQATPHTVTDGDVTPFLTDANGRLIVAATDNGASLTVDNAGLTELAAAIDTEVQCDIVGALPAGTNAIGKLAANSGVDIGDVDVTSLPKSIQGPGIPNIDSYTSAAISAAANTADQSLVAAPGANKQIWVYGFVGTADTADGSVSLQDEDNTAASGVMVVTLRGGFAISPSGNFSMPWLKIATNKALEIDTVTCGFKGVISYAIVSV